MNQTDTLITSRGCGSRKISGPGASVVRMTMTLLLALVCMSAANAQRTMDVAGFKKLENDLMARVTAPVRDHDEGKLCALIRIVSPLNDIKVRPDGLGIVEEREVDGEHWVYVPYGARSLSLTHTGYVPVMFSYPFPIEEGTVYELRLTVPEEGSARGGNSSTQMLALTVRPADATVWIDEMEVPVEEGVVLASINKGPHTYRVEAPMYEDVEEEIELGDSPVRENVALFPLFGTLNVSTLPEHGFEVIANGKNIGLSPIKDYRFEPGTYRIHVQKKNYHSLDTVVRMRAGSQMDLNLRLTSHADSLFYNRRLGGRGLSFGVRAGYLQPMVSTDSKGGFTGSVINYGLGNSRENVHYSGQTGFTAGLIVDIRLIKNLYLQTGLDYNYIHYTNKFSSLDENVVLTSTSSTVTVGSRNNAYTEQYTFHELKLPVMASYRFVLSKRSSLHINLGPYLSYGIAANMKLNGSTDSRGMIYGMQGGQPDYDKGKGEVKVNSHTTGDLNLYSKSQKISITEEQGANLGFTQNPKFKFSSSPLERLNYGLCAGAVFELSRFQLGVHYSLELSNRAKSSFWKSDRITLFEIPAENIMASYRHNIHTLGVTVGYVLR
ncbi:MAG: outer membrane beta-barrel protein [Muribaculaceae bacterium]|nr:outer membrane beta-barrel protein [Muribaculaceae bacterium]